MICWPRAMRYSMGTLTALAISDRFSHALSLLTSSKGRSVSRAAYRAMSARSRAPCSKFSKILDAGMSIFRMPKKCSDTAFNEYVARLWLRRTYCSKSSCCTPGVSSTKNLFWPAALLLNSNSRVRPPPSRARPISSASTKGAAVVSSSSTPMRPAKYRKSNWCMLYPSSTSAWCSRTRRAQSLITSCSRSYHTTCGASRGASSPSRSAVSLWHTTTRANGSGSPYRWNVVEMLMMQSSGFSPCGNPPRAL